MCVKFWCLACGYLLIHVNLIFIIGTGIDNAGGMPPEISGTKKNRFHGLRGILKLQKKLLLVACLTCRYEFFLPILK